MLKVNSLSGFNSRRPLVSFLPRAGLGEFSDQNTTCTFNAFGNAAGPDIFRNAGKWYMECTLTDGGQGRAIGIAGSNFAFNSHLGFNNFNGAGYGWFGTSGGVVRGNATVATYSTYTNGDVVAIAMDFDNLLIYFRKNGVWQNSADPVAGTGGFSIVSGLWTPAVSGGSTSGSGQTIWTRANFGQWANIYPPPNGYSFF
jgi:hypothetical protein